MISIQTGIILFCHNRLNNLCTNPYDTTLLGSGKDGILFTVDGFYYRDFTKPIFINFSDISDINTSKSSITFKLKSNSNDSFSIITVLNYSTFKIVLQKLMRIDSEYGNTSLKSTGKVKKVDIPPDMEKKCHAITCKSKFIRTST